MLAMGTRRHKSIKAAIKVPAPQTGSLKSFLSRKHLGRYVAEFDFRWNSRKDTDGERTVAGLKQAQGKRLTMNETMSGRVKKSTI